MTMYRKKPVVIEAVQYLSGIQDYILFFCKNGTREVYFDKKTRALAIITLEGVMIANVGDWIIKGINGEFYPCKNDIFEKTYEEVVEE